MHLPTTIFVAALNIFGYTMREFVVDGGICLVAVVVGVVANVIGYQIMRHAAGDASIPRLADGLVRRSKTFDGNVSEGKTLEVMLTGLKALPGATGERFL